MDLQTWASVAAVIVSVIALVRGEVLHRRTKPDEARRDAANRIGDAVSGLHALLVHADVDYPSPPQVRSAMRQFESEWRRLGRRLPRGAQHLGSSVREAMANLFGRPASSGLGPDAEYLPAHPFNSYWWDIGLTYIEYVHAELSAWLVDDRRRPLVLVPYYEWRRDEDSRASR